MAIKPVNLDQFYVKAGNIYEAVIVTAKRSRQIHEDTKIELNKQLETIKQLTATPETDEESETNIANPDQLKISLEFEKRAKPTETALTELLEGNIGYRYKSDEE